MPVRTINPFIPGGPVPVSGFIGRRKEVRSILSQLANPNALGSSAISGEPRSGKTSLLDYVSDFDIAGEYGLTPERHIFVRIDSQTLSKYMQDQGLQILTDDAFWHYILQSLIAEQKYETELARKLHDQDKITIFDLNELFDEIVSKNKLLVLLLDEFDWIIAHIDPQRPSLLDTLRSLINQPVARRGLALVISSQEPLDILCKGIRFDGSPFPNSLMSLPLKRFSTQEARELIKEYLRGAGAPFTEDDIEWATRISGCHPYFLQLGCFYLFDAYREKEEISQDDREKARQVAEENLRIQANLNFIYYWGHSSKDERSLLTILAQRSQARGLKAWMANRRYRKLSGQRALTSLVNQGIVVKSDDGHDIFSPLFAMWIASQKINTMPLEPPEANAEAVAELAKLVSPGESAKLEFKSTFQWDVELNQVNKELRFSVLKTIAAFLNTAGGTLVIGVEDDGHILGLAQDLKIMRNSKDRFEQTLMNSICDCIGAEFAPFIKTRFEEIDGRTVCVVDVDRAPEPAFVKGPRDKEEFFIRVGSTTRPLDMEKAMRYIRRNWEQ